MIWVIESSVLDDDDDDDDDDGILHPPKKTKGWNLELLQTNEEGALTLNYRVVKGGGSKGRGFPNLP